MVVGGANSANTAELTRLVTATGIRVLQIESTHQLVDAAAFADARTVGITGGTSTPLEDLATVAERVASLAGTPQVRAQARELASEAAAAVAEKAYRTTSLLA